MRNIVTLIVLLISFAASSQVLGLDVLNFGTKTTAEMNAISASKIQVGSYLDNSDTETLWRYNGSIWEDQGSGGGASYDDTAIQAEVDLNTAKVTNTDSQDLSLAGNTLNISGGTGVDLTPILSDTQLTDAEVATAATNEGFVTGNHTIDTNTQLSDGDITALGYIKTDTNTQLSDGEIGAFGYIKTDTDTQLTDSEVATAVNSEFPNLDTDSTNDFDGAWASITGIPADIADGDTDTQLTETQVDAFANNNGYIKDENQTISSQFSFTSNLHTQSYITTGFSGIWTGAPTNVLGKRWGITLNSSDGLTFTRQTTNSTSVSGGNPASFFHLRADGTAVNNNDILNKGAGDARYALIGSAGSGTDGAITDLTLVGTTLQVTGTGTAENVDVDLSSLSGGTTQDLSISGTAISITAGTGIDIASAIAAGDTDTQLNETQVDAFIANNNYVVSGTAPVLDATNFTNLPSGSMTTDQINRLANVGQEVFETLTDNYSTIASDFQKTTGTDIGKRTVKVHDATTDFTVTITDAIADGQSNQFLNRNANGSITLVPDTNIIFNKKSGYNAVANDSTRVAFIRHSATDFELIGNFSWVAQAPVGNPNLWSPNSSTDPDNESTTLGNWAARTPATLTVATSTAQVDDGSSSISMTQSVSGTGADTEIFTTSGTVAAGTYLVSVRFFAPATLSGLRFRVFSDGEATTLAQTFPGGNGAWQTYSTTVTIAADTNIGIFFRLGHNVDPYADNGNSAQTAYIDTVTLKLQ
jgi:hypothetical protein